MSDGGRMGGELEPPGWARLIEKVATADFPGMSASDKAAVKRDLHKNLGKESKRTVEKVLKKAGKKW